MKRRHHRRTSWEQPSFQIAPFIDIVFVIMLFFLVKAFVQPREHWLRALLPGRQESSVAQPIITEDSVEVDADGQISHNADPVSPEDLAERMARLRAECRSTRSPLLVTVATQPDTPFASMVTALNALSRAGVHDVAFSQLDD